MTKKTSGATPFAFAYCADLRSLPQSALAHEQGLHGGFAVDKRPNHGEIYYGMAGCGLLRVSPDLTTHEILELPGDLKDVNFHSSRLAEFDGHMRLILAANLEAQVIVADLEGNVDFVLSRPEFEEYADAEQPFRPTDTAVTTDRLFVADGYGANYIAAADPEARAWAAIFGGKTADPAEHGRFGTAHGMSVAPSGHHLSIADRLHSRFEIYTFDGQFTESFALPPGARPCGIDYMQRDGLWYAVVGSLDDPDPNRAAPIYILDGESHRIISTIRPKEELGIELADHIHNVVWHEHGGQTFLVCQSWNPGFYFVLEMV